MDESADSERLRGRLRQLGTRSKAEVSHARARAHAALFGSAIASPEPRRVGRYRLLEPIGQGGLGAVWRAHDPQLDRIVAIKLVRDDVLARDRRAREQLLAEAASMAALTHPNIVRVYDLGETEGELFVAMEFVEGQTLRAHVNGLSPGERSWRRIVELYLAAGEGLAAAHAAGHVHGDFKPDNVLVGQAGRVLVGDFAVNARVLSQGLVGTPPYMAPEQLDGAASDAASDQFAYCVALWESLTGARPFAGASVDALRAQITAGPPAQVDTDAPASVLALIRRGLASTADQRHPDMRALLDALSRKLDRRRRLRLGVGAAVLVAIGIGGAGLALLGPRPPSATASCPIASARDSLDFDDSARTTLATRLAASSLSDPQRAEVLADLDAFVHDWTEARDRACRFGGVLLGPKRVQGRDWVPCMDAAATSFTTSVELLRAPELRPELVAEPLATELPDPRRCIEPRPIEVHVGRGLSSDSRQTLARARALSRAHRLDEALALLAPLHAAAQANDQYELLAHVELVRGIALDRLGRQREALRALEHAEVLAEFSDDPSVELRAAARICMVLMRLDERPSLLAAAAERHAYLAERLGDPVEILSAQLDIGYATLRAGQAREALAIELAALAAAEQRLDPDSPLLSSAHDYIGAAYGELGDGERARAHKRRALELVSREYGPEHIDVVTLLQTSARIMTMVGERDTARADLERALEIVEAQLGPESPRSATLRWQLADYWLHEGDRAQALALLAGSEGPGTALALARAELDHGELDAAWAHWRVLVSRLATAPAGSDPVLGAQADEIEARLLLAGPRLSDRDRSRIEAIITGLELRAELREQPRDLSLARALELALALAQCDDPAAGTAAPKGVRLELDAAREALASALTETPGLAADFRAWARVLLWRAAPPALRRSAADTAHRALARAYGPAHPARTWLGAKD